VVIRTVSVAVTIILAVGAVLLYRQRSIWWESYLQQRMWGWITLALLAGPSLLIIPIVRPRPEYLYGLTFLIIAALGMSAAVILRRWISDERFQAVSLALVVLALILVPNHYADPSLRKPQTYRTMYDRLEPFIPLIARPDTVILQPGFDDFENYAAGLQLVLPGDDKSVVRPLMGKPVHYMTLSERQPGEPFERFLDRRGINYVYMNEDLIATLEPDPLAQTMLNSPDSLGWKVIGSQEVGNTRWRLLQKTTQIKSAGDDRVNLSAAMAPQTD
jgi:hypothetical protein